MEDYYWLNEESRIFLKRDYLKKDQSPEERIKEIAEAAQKILNKEDFAKKFVDYMKKGYYSLSTPVWTNFGNERGLPVSCFGSFISDDITSILDNVAEIGIMSKQGGGTSIYLGELRERGAPISRGGHSDGPVHFLELYNKATEVVSQGSSRRGSVAAYLPVEHPDILEFLKINSKNHPVKNCNFAVTITNQWMKDMLNGDKKKAEIWVKIIKKKYETGYPYVTFIDNANNQAPEVYKKNNIKIKASNLCNEIMLQSDENNSFVCVLSSLNLLHWDEIKKTDAIEVLTYFLDAVNEEFIFKTKGMKHMERARNFARTQRALGLGVLGWHSLLQSKMIPFESFDATILNAEVFQVLKSRSNKASEDMAKEYGEPELLKGIGRRNVTLNAIAPTTSSSFILGQVSSGIEPLNSNYFVKKLAKGNFSYKNPFLFDLLEKKGKKTTEVLKSILIRGGSVQHLDFLSKKEKNVFKTFGEINQKDIISQAAQRQQYIDQGQSLNIMIPPDVPWPQVSKLMIEAWYLGIKGLYYQRSANPAQELSRKIKTCSNCEG